MKTASDPKAPRRRSSEVATGRLTPRRRLAGVSSILVVLTAVCHPSVSAQDVDTAPQWNIMVVPSNPAVFAGEARTIFNKHCASCHSQDGRAQTPIALERHVQDLSECTLTDDEIIQQILDGTQAKPNTFKMPAFRGKLTRSQIESLVPLVKAFRPAEETLANDPPPLPRLAGMLNGSFGSFAILETLGGSGRYFMLRNKERHGGVRLVRFMPRKGSVRLEPIGTNALVTLTLRGWSTTHPKKKGVAGFLGRLGDSLNEAPTYLILDHVNTDLILFLYAQSTGRTLLCSPGLPDVSFNLNLRSGNRSYIAQKLKQALKAEGVATIAPGEKWLLVVPESEATAASSRFSEARTLACTSNSPDPFPGGVMVNFHDADLSEVLSLYARVTGRTFSASRDLLRPDTKVDLTTQAALSSEDGAHALETLLWLHHLEVVPVGSDSFTVTPVSIQLTH